MSEAQTADLLSGVTAIAEYLNLPERRVRHLVECPPAIPLPIFKMGQIICARRAGIDGWLIQCEVAAKRPSHDGADQ